jgi:hypothetical protein
VSDKIPTMLIKVAASEVQDSRVSSYYGKRGSVSLNTSAKCLDIGAYRADKKDVGSSSKNRLLVSYAVRMMGDYWNFVNMGDLRNSGHKSRA